MVNDGWNQCARKLKEMWECWCFTNTLKSTSTLNSRAVGCQPLIYIVHHVIAHNYAYHIIIIIYHVWHIPLSSGCVEFSSSLTALTISASQCLRLCLIMLCFSVKRAWHTSHSNGRSPERDQQSAFSISWGDKLKMPSSFNGPFCRAFWQRTHGP